MKNVKFIYLVAGLAVFSTAQFSRAEDVKPPVRPSREEFRETLKNLTPEERAAKVKEFKEKNPQAGAALEKRGEEMKKLMKELGLDQAELQKLPPEERRTKLKQAVDKKMAELEKKKAAGTLSDSDKETMRLIEQRRKMVENRREGALGRSNTPPGEKPVEKPADK
ncbi:MAG: hypothetical protein ABIQ35_13370 [Verrucomicrobiota bacterium]